MSAPTEKNLKASLPASEWIEGAGNTTINVEDGLSSEEVKEPELHAQTYFALAAMFFLNLVQVFGLMGPPAGVSRVI